MKLRDYLPSGQTLLEHLAKSVATMALILFAFALLGALVGCGGGDPEDQVDSVKTIDPPTCSARPEACK